MPGASVPPVIDTELGRLAPADKESSLSGREGNCPEEETLVGGQHLEGPQSGAVRGPLGQASIQSSVLDMEPVGSAASTNSGWIVVEWIPSLWKNSFTFSATLSTKYLKLGVIGVDFLPACTGPS